MLHLKMEHFSLSTKFFFLSFVFAVLCSSEAVIQIPNNETVPAVIMFGDSIVDTGNNNGLTSVVKCDFPPYGRDFNGGMPTGRFSNGKVPSDFLGFLKTLSLSLSLSLSHTHTHTHPPFMVLKYMLSCCLVTLFSFSVLKHIHTSIFMVLTPDTRTVLLKLFFSLFSKAISLPFFRSWPVTWFDEIKI